MTTSLSDPVGTNPPATHDRLRSADLLTRALLDALETMAFTSADPADDSMFGETAGAPCRVTIPFIGPLCGSFELDAPTAIGKALAETVFCAQSSDPEVPGRAEDALMELANVTCGLMLRKIGAMTGEHFELCAPSCRSASPSEEWRHLLALSGTVALQVNGQPLLARMNVPFKGGIH